MTTIAFIIGFLLSLTGTFMGHGEEYHDLSLETKLRSAFIMASSGFMFFYFGTILSHLSV